MNILFRVDNENKRKYTAKSRRVTRKNIDGLVDPIVVDPIVTYNGAPEEHEDYADYVTFKTIRGVILG
jgi:hypothetical protein